MFKVFTSINFKIKVRNLKYNMRDWQGRIQDIHLGGGGGHKRLCEHMHIMSAKPKVPYMAWVQGPL